MGIFGKLFGQKSNVDSGQRMSQHEAVQIIQRYGAVLEHESPTPGTVADESKLPYPKNQLKEALIIALRATTDHQMRNFLQIGYIQLADWQKGVGISNVGLDLTNLDQNPDVSRLAEKISAQGAGFEKWKPVIEAEQENLKAELIELGLWGDK